MKVFPNRKILPFISVMLIYQFLLAVLVAVYGYEDSFKLLNGFHSDWLDAPMFLITHLGDALILTSLLGLFLIRKQPELIMLLIVIVILTGLFGQLLKNTLFDSWDRPLSVFGPSGGVHTVYNYLLYQNSFPSGHSITVAAAFTTLAMVIRPNKWVMVLLALLTVLVSYTRIYVGAHFAADVLAGTILGVAGALFLTVWLYPAISRWIENFNPIKLMRLKSGLYILAVLGLAGGILMMSDYFRQL